MKVPHKVKTFAWKACIKALPIRSNLKRRKIIEDATCQLCSTGIKSTAHALHQCQLLKEMWSKQLSRVRSARTYEDFREMVVRVQGSHCNDDLENCL